MTIKLFVLLILAAFASEKNGAENDPKYGERFGKNKNNSILVKIEEDEYVKVNKKSKYIGVIYSREISKWRAQRWSKGEKKKVYNGCYDDEETAALASDTLAKKLMENGKQKLKLNLPDDHTEVYPEEKKCKYIGVYYNKDNSKWRAQRWSKTENKLLYNGCYDDEEAAAHASDTLASKLIENDDQKLKLNFPDNYTEVYPERAFTSKYIGVTCRRKNSKWYAQRWDNTENKSFSNGWYEDEETAAHASDTLAIKLMENGKQKLKLNFPDDHTEVYQDENQKKRKRPKNFGLEHPQNN